MATDAELLDAVRELQERLPEDMVELADFEVWPGFEELVHPEFEAEMIGPFGFTQARPGLEGLLEGWRDFLEAFEEFRVRTEELIPVGGGALVLVEQHGRMRGSEADVTTSSALVWRFRDGLIARAEFFLDADEGRRAADISSG